MLYLRLRVKPTPNRTELNTHRKNGIFSVERWKSDEPRLDLMQNKTKQNKNTKSKMVKIIKIGHKKKQKIKN